MEGVAYHESASRALQPCYTSADFTGDKVSIRNSFSEEQAMAGSWGFSQGILGKGNG